MAWDPHWRRQNIPSAGKIVPPLFSECQEFVPPTLLVTAPLKAQLIDAQTGGNLWAERYDGEMIDVFALKDKMTGRIIEALSISLGTEERALLVDHGTTNIEAHDAFLRGQS